MQTSTAHHSPENTMNNVNREELIRDYIEGAWIDRNVAPIGNVFHMLSDRFSSIEDVAHYARLFGFSCRKLIGQRGPKMCVILSEVVLANDIANDQTSWREVA
jgi:hypothetical protein